MTEESLLPDVPRPPRRYKVTVTLTRTGDEILPPALSCGLAELAAAAVVADGLRLAGVDSATTLWLVVDLPCRADALSAGVAVARAMGGEGAASVQVDPMPAPQLTTGRSSREDPFRAVGSGPFHPEAIGVA